MLPFRIYYDEEEDIFAALIAHPFVPARTRWVGIALECGSDFFSHTSSPLQPIAVRVRLRESGGSPGLGAVEGPPFQSEGRRIGREGQEERFRGPQHKGLCGADFFPSHDGREMMPLRQII